jgi:hypothetical protein
MRHAEANQLIRKHFSGNARVCFIDPNKYVTSENDYIDDNINHHCMRIRHLLADDMFKILQDEGVSATRSSTYSVLKRRVLTMVRRSMQFLSNGKATAN